MTFKTALLSTIAFGTAGAFAFMSFADDHKESEKEEDAKWDVQNQPMAQRDIDINVTEGTWMSLDVSPDG